MTKRTLVQELREHSANAELNRNMLTAALTAQAADRIEELQNGFEGCCYACEPVGEMNKKVQQERDEARREICRLHVLYSRFYLVGEEGECAKDREWDCFKETP